MTVVHLVSHTHWDREWYLPAARFRQRLVALVDELLDAPPSGGASFLLDGQTVVLEDYLAVRPERAAELSALLQKGVLEAGPWYVLADELIPGGEALVRNLLAGRRAMRALRASAPPVLYCPDSFGHPAAMPALAHGFGYATAIALRGYGSARLPAGDAAWWIAPGGERVLLYHLPVSGYDIGQNLPADRGAARDRWASMRAQLVARSRLGVVLLLNGADHHARQERLGVAIAALTEAARPDEIRAGSLGAFAADLERQAVAHDGGGAASLPEVRGELRDSYGFVWTLQGTFATRAHQKRRNAHIERLLVRDAEPWAALAVWAARAGTSANSGSEDGSRAPGASSGVSVATLSSPTSSAPSRRALVDAAWRSLLLCHPHDTLCGCSTDEVARAMDARLDEAHAQAAGIRDDALGDLIGHRAEHARERRDEWRPMVVVRNRSARPRGGVALLRVTSFLSDVKVGANASPGPVTTAPRAMPAIAGAAAVQVLARAEAHELTESPRHYPDDDLVLASEVAAWVPEVPAYGIRCLEHTRRGRRGEVPNPARAVPGELHNGRITVRVDGDGRVELTDHERARTIPDLLWWDSVVDCGDLYTPSPRGRKFTPLFEGARVVHKGPVRAGMESRWSFRAGRERVSLRRRLMVDADARWLRIRIEGANASSDHRLRCRIATDVARPRVVADAMFGPIERRPLVVSEADARMERPERTAPLHRYVSLFGDGRGATVFSDGLAEYEVDDAGIVYVTLVRAVGELSRDDLPERNGHAGWPTPTPEAQCHGPFGAELALLLHGDRAAAVVDEIERAADDILLPLTGATLRSALHRPEPVRGIELTGEGLAFSCAKESEDGQWLVLRCVNLLDEERAGRWRLAGPIGEARLARLDETPLAPLTAEGDAIPFVAPPRAIVTILAR